MAALEIAHQGWHNAWGKNSRYIVVQLLNSLTEAVHSDGSYQFLSFTANTETPTIHLDNHWICHRYTQSICPGKVWTTNIKGAVLLLEIQNKACFLEAQGT